MKVRKGLLFSLLVLLACGLIAACGGGGSSDNYTPSSDTDSSLTDPDYGGSVPRGDYVTATVKDEKLKIINYTLDTEIELSFEDGQLLGSSIIKKTAEDVDGNYYYFAQIDDVLGVVPFKDDETTTLPEPTGLPFYMFSKGELSVEDLKGKAYNFLEVNASEENGLLVEIGIVGFDSDADGRLYGAAFSSDDPDGYSITDEDGEENSGDEFKLSETTRIDDGSLVIWEDGEEGSWLNATTITGTTSGPLILDHGPGDIAGGGAGFALPQVTETDPDTFWETVAGDYFVIETTDDGVDVYRCTVAQKTASAWEGELTVIKYEDGYQNPVTATINPLDDDKNTAIETFAHFSKAQSEAVRNATKGGGIFQGYAEDHTEVIVAFDPQGKYIGIVGGVLDNAEEAFFSLGVRDDNWGDPVPQ